MAVHEFGNAGCRQIEASDSLELGQPQVRSFESRYLPFLNKVLGTSDNDPD